MVNYYGKFVPRLSTKATPLYHLLKKDVEFVWSVSCQKSFDVIKEHLISAPILAHYNPDFSLRLYTDSSYYGLGSFLTQIENDGSEKPTGYASRSLNSAELKYSVIDKEATAIMFCIKKWNQYLFCNKFTLVTDHKPKITRIFCPKKGLPVYAAPRLQRYAVFLASHDFNIEYVNTKYNGPADGCLKLL